MQASKCRCKGESLSGYGLVSAAEWQYFREAENIEKKGNKNWEFMPRTKNPAPKHKQTKRLFYHFVLVLAESWVQTLSFGSGSGQDLY